MQFDQETRRLIWKNLSSFRVIGTKSSSRILEIMQDFLSHIPECEDDQILAHLVIQRWIQVRKPKQRLTTTLKLLTKELGVNLSGIWEECSKSRHEAENIQTTHSLRLQLEQLELKANYHQKMIDHHTQCISKSTQKLNKLPEHMAKFEFALISRALPCVNRLFNAVFHEYKGFNNAFVFHMVNNIVSQRAETTQKALQ
jgi:hypothetical protein